MRPPPNATLNFSLVSEKYTLSDLLKFTIEPELYIKLSLIIGQPDIHTYFRLVMIYKIKPFRIRFPCVQGSRSVAFSGF